MSLGSEANDGRQVLTPDSKVATPALALSEPYRPRPVRFIEEWSHAGWRVKVYGISYGRELPRAGLVETAKRVARERLPRPAVGGGRYGVGFVGVHDGRGANFVFVDWWADENELHHHVYTSPSDELIDLKYTTPTGLSVCVWDLKVQSFERDAWVEEVLTNPRGPDVEGYMRRRMNEDV